MDIRNEKVTRAYVDGNMVTSETKEEIVNAILKLMNASCEIGTTHKRRKNQILESIKKSVKYRPHKIR